MLFLEIFPKMQLNEFQLTVIAHVIRKIDFRYRILSFARTQRLCLLFVPIDVAEVIRPSVFVAINQFV